MSGLYIHIPFCKKACHYCDFHFSTSLKYQQRMVEALCMELNLRADEFKNQTVETIYFGGGTPSLLSLYQLEQVYSVIQENYHLADVLEVTLEANPDDLSKVKIQELASSFVNRLSIGVQSFDDTELQMMNRAHNATEVLECLSEATRYFENITIDLMYGVPGLTSERWRQNIQKALDLGISHISSYALTVEVGTALAHFIQQGKYPPLDEALAEEHFTILCEELAKAGFDHYEISNFGKPDFYSKHNTSYWLGKTYLGIGPSAHSYDGTTRSWNVANNMEYMKALQQKELPSEKEELNANNRFNEYIMTGLRTIWGVSLTKIEGDFGTKSLETLLYQVQPFLENQTLEIVENTLKTTAKGKFLADGIASELFVVS